MLKKIYRLSSLKLSSPKSVNSQNFILKTSINSLDIPRFGFVISKKVDKSAVVRNSLKRKISMTAEHLFDRIEGGRDFVFYPKASMIDASRESVAQEIEELFKKERFIK